MFAIYLALLMLGGEKEGEIFLNGYMNVLSGLLCVKKRHDWRENF